jgi:hypothetical protein
MGISCPDLYSVWVKQQKVSSFFDPGECHPGGLQHFLRHGICIPFLIYYVTNTGVDEHLRTDRAGEVGAVKRGSSDGNPMIGSLDDDVLFRMKPSTQFVSFTRRNPKFLPETANLKTVSKSRRGSVVSSRENAFVRHRDCPDLAAEASRTLGHEKGNVHEICFP